MKRITLLLVYTFPFFIQITSCKNDRTDDTRADTTVIVMPNPSPVPGTQSNTDSTGLIKKESVSVSMEKKKILPAEKKIAITSKPKDSTADVVRVKKVSKKGRIILQSLKLNMEEKIEADPEGVYNRAEVMPLYHGGENALREFIENNIQYPDNAINSEIQGTVKVSFAVDDQGKIYAPTVVSTKLGYGLEEEALRVVKRMPKWIPGQVNGQNVKTRITLPITYKID